jgi:hypothetical protein
MVGNFTMSVLDFTDGSLNPKAYKLEAEGFNFKKGRIED